MAMARLTASMRGSPVSAGMDSPSISMVVSGVRTTGVFIKGLAWYLAWSMVARMRWLDGAFAVGVRVRSVDESGGCEDRDFGLAVCGLAWEVLSAEAGAAARAGVCGDEVSEC